MLISNESVVEFGAILKIAFSFVAENRPIEQFLQVELPTCNTDESSNLKLGCFLPVVI